MYRWEANFKMILFFKGTDNIIAFIYIDDFKVRFLFGNYNLRNI